MLTKICHSQDHSLDNLHIRVVRKREVYITCRVVTLPQEKIECMVTGYNYSRAMVKVMEDNILPYGAKFSRGTIFAE